VVGADGGTVMHTAIIIATFSIIGLVSGFFLGVAWKPDEWRAACLMMVSILRRGAEDGREAMAREVAFHHQHDIASAEVNALANYTMSMSAATAQAVRWAERTARMTEDTEAETFLRKTC
jgi:hypothetical protein